MALYIKNSLEFLKTKGFKATEKTRMREIANALGVTPYEVFDKLKTIQ